jgi:hypothetical protein
LSSAWSSREHPDSLEPILSTGLARLPDLRVFAAGQSVVADLGSPRLAVALDEVGRSPGWEAHQVLLNCSSHRVTADQAESLTPRRVVGRSLQILYRQRTSGISSFASRSTVDHA